MRQEKDGDIEPTIEDMEAAKEMLTNLLELVGERDEHAPQLKNDIKTLKRNIQKARSKTGT
tara:strand:+ start:302 stop:484 length:183 start_codon:yes stop_codon:yes gene_type:complete